MGGPPGSARETLDSSGVGFPPAGDRAWRRSTKSVEVTSPPTHHLAVHNGTRVIISGSKGGGIRETKHRRWRSRSFDRAVPHWPNVLAPQHVTVPSSSRAHECAAPSPNSTTPRIPDTAVVPRAPRRDPSAPKQRTVASSKRTHVFAPPATALLIPRQSHFCRTAFPQGTCPWPTVLLRCTSRRLDHRNVGRRVNNRHTLHGRCTRHPCRTFVQLQRADALVHLLCKRLWCTDYRRRRAGRCRR